MLRKLLLITVAGMLAAVAKGADPEPPINSYLPAVGNEWVKRPDAGTRGNYSWINFEQQKTAGEILAFVSYKASAGIKVTDSVVSQASIEMFNQNGRASHNQPRGESIGDLLRHRVISINIASDNTKHEIEALEYTYVFDTPGQEPTIAHGYSVVVGEQVVFVQHTSVKPISSQLAFDMATNVISKHLKLDGKPHSISRGRVRKTNG